MGNLRVSIFVMIFAAVAQYAAAGEYHFTSGGMLCSDCHSVHASKSGQESTPHPFLLKYSGEVPLCLSCHDGTDQNAPDVVSNGTSSAPTSIVATAYTSKYGSSAGFFQSDYMSGTNDFGHDLSGATTAPLSTSFSKPDGLACSDCHATHGTTNFRNLVSDPNPAHPGSFNIVLGTNVKETVAVNAVSPNPAQAYDTGNVSLFTNNNVKGWCTDCHDLLAQDAQGTSPAHFARHPSDVAVGGSYGHAALSNWLSGTLSETTGFGTNIGDSAVGIPRLRYGSASGSNTIAASGDTVTCLTCHKAHGSVHKAGLAWPYLSDSADSLSGCQQCHYK